MQIFPPLFSSFIEKSFLFVLFDIEKHGCAAQIIKLGRISVYYLDVVLTVLARARILLLRIFFSFFFFLFIRRRCGGNIPFSFSFFLFLFCSFVARFLNKRRWRSCYKTHIYRLLSLKICCSFVEQLCLLPPSPAVALRPAFFGAQSFWKRHSRSAAPDPARQPWPPSGKTCRCTLVHKPMHVGS